MSASCRIHDLVIGSSAVSGDHGTDVDTALCADVARATAQVSRLWANDDTWTGLGGFDASGAFWLEPMNDGELLFRRARRSFGWLRDPDAPRQEAVASPFQRPLCEHFPAALPPPGFHAPAAYPRVQSCLLALPGFGGCAFRHPTSGIWKTVIAAANGTRLANATRAFTPLARMLQAQGLPVGRLLLTAKNSAAIAFRTPTKVYGYLQIDDLPALPAAAALADELLRCASQKEVAQ